MVEIIQDWLVNQGINNTLSVVLVRSVLVALVMVLGIIANYVAKRFILSGLTYLISRTKIEWDDTFLRRKVLNKLSHLAPALVIYVASPLVLTGYDRLIALVTSALIIYMIIIAILVIDSSLNAFLDIYRTFEVAKEIPIKGFIQVLKIVIYFIGGI
ncbi:MAG: mechanosensitive ion channel family protein, partial [Simkaniaceae bacterium]|nr:mechanosensitive ion channel family protein [Simkaniaceae bacterium]